MEDREKDNAEPKAYIYVPGQARLNIKNIQEDPPKTKYDKRKAVLRREDVIDQVTKRKTELDANTDH